MNNTKVYFLSYVKKTICCNAIKFKQKQNKLYDYEKMFLNTLEDEGEEKINFIIDKNNDIENVSFIDSDSFYDVFENRDLVKGFETLTKKQKEVIFEIFKKETSERELAQKLNTSFQNINKLKKSALEKLKINLLKTNEINNVKH